MAITDEIKSRIDILEIVSERFQLHRAGRNYKANCPFHEEKTPSFIVNPDRQTWRCFGQCSTGGDIFTFVMKIDGLEFAEALRLLGNRAGVEMSLKNDSVEKNTYYEINELALNFYREALLSPEAKQARNYLDQRGISREVWEEFGLGYSPRNRSSLKDHIAFHGIELPEAVECGLLSGLDDGTIRDFFWGRLMIPIHERTGKIVAFGGRSLDGSMPKYINTAATPVFDKKRILYGFHKAIEAIRQENQCVIVEGYMDVIAAHEHGYRNVVASMGTALTPEQVRQLRNVADSYVLALDQDAAGQEATLRSLESSWKIFDTNYKDRNELLTSSNSVSLKVLSLPEGKDPDEFIRSGNGDWKQVVSEALPLMDYLIPVVASRFDIDSIGAKGKVVATLAPLFHMMDHFDKDKYIKKLAQELESQPETVTSALAATPLRRSKFRGADTKSNLRAHRNASDVQVSEMIAEPDIKRVTHVLSLLFRRPSLRRAGTLIDPECFRRIEDRELFTLWMASESNLETWHLEISDPALKQRYDAILAEELIPSTYATEEKDLNMCIRLLSDRLERERAGDVTEAYDPELPPTEEQQTEISDRNKRIVELHKLM